MTPSEFTNFLWKIRISHEGEVNLEGVLQFMIEAMTVVIVRLHAKREAVAEAQAALLEEAQVQLRE